MFSKECAKCGSTDHATDNCPHGFFSSKRKPHPTDPVGEKVTSSSYSSDDGSDLIVLVLKFAGVVLGIFIVFWLIDNIVLPVALLNSALALTILALCFRQHKTLFAALALVGGCYMLWDIINGWFSVNFVDNVVKDPNWIRGFAYINAAAIGLSTWLLVEPLWSKAKLIETSDKRKSRILMSTSILLVAIAITAVPIVFHTVQNPFTPKVNWSIQQTTDEERLQKPREDNVSTHNVAPSEPPVASPPPAAQQTIEEERLRKWREGDLSTYNVAPSEPPVASPPRTNAEELAQSQGDCKIFLINDFMHIVTPYKGGCKDGLADGHGSFTSLAEGRDISDTISTNGEFAHGKLNGKATEIYSRGVTEGEYRENMPWNTISRGVDERGVAYWMEWRNGVQFAVCSGDGLNEKNCTDRNKALGTP